MPELPEVQTVVNTLNSSSLFKSAIAKVNVLTPKILKNSTPKNFASFIVGEKFVNAERRGKYIVLFLTNKKVLTIHLRMEGKLFYENNVSNSKHLRIQIIFSDGKFLNFYDSRMFGTFHIYKNENEMNDSKELSKVNFDVLDSKFNAPYLLKIFKNSNVAIKTSLLDQSNVSGIGNIYADEILFASKVSPIRPSKTIKKNELERIVSNSKKIMKKAIKFKGTTIMSYKSNHNTTGQYQKFLLIHGKQFCPICKTKIEKIFVNGRGTYYCKHCQK